MKKGMAYSDDEDEGEAQSLCLSNYHLEDDNDMPVSFTVLPIKWSESEDSDDACKEKVFIHGYVDSNRLKKMLPVKAWRFNLSSVKPSISMQTKDGNWISLQSPRKSFAATIRTILITIHFLHYAKKNPKLSSSRSVWDNLSKVKDLSSYKSKPSLSDLVNHMPLISEAAKRDGVLAKSKLLLTILEENPGNRKLSDEEVHDMMDEANEESETEDDVCAICDNGGKLVCCDGGCKRSFHATVEHGRESVCDSLGLTKKEVYKKTFYCKNCEHKLHQCFACGKLGSSGLAKGAEVIQCDSPTCYHFYHPHCVSKLLPQVVKHDVEGLEKNIADGNRFTCPVHYCCVCKEGENRTDPELQFAVCRRCPKSYHRKCLPREFAFADEDGEDIIPRAWEGLLSNNRILIYCLNHEIDDELGTPIRDHIKFPNFKATDREINTTKEKMKPTTKERVISNKNNVDSDISSDKGTVKGSKVTGKLSSGKLGSKKSENIISGSNISRKSKSKETSRRCSFENKRSPPLDIDSARRLLALVEEVKSEVTLDSVKKQIASDYTPLLLSHDILESTDDKEDQASMEPECMKSKSGETSQKRKHIEENDSSPAKRQAVNGRTGEVPDHSQSNPNNGRSSAEGSHPACPNIEVSDNSRIKEGSSVVSALSDSSGTNKEGHDSRGGEEKQQRESDEREPDSATEPSYKLNHVRMMGSEPPAVNRSGTYERSVLQPGYGAGQLSFASGPNLEYSLQHSVGWLDE